MKRLVTIYTNVLTISAHKGGFHRHCDEECRRANHNYIHEFGGKAKLLGIPDGARLMLRDGTVIPISDGSMLVSDKEY